MKFRVYRIWPGQRCKYLGTVRAKSRNDAIIKHQGPNPLKLESDEGSHVDAYLEPDRPTIAVAPPTRPRNLKERSQQITARNRKPAGRRDRSPAVEPCNVTRC